MSENKLRKPGSLSVDTYVGIVRGVWSDFHERRITLDYALHLFDHASKLGEAIRKDELDRIFDELAELTNWLFSFVAKLGDEKSESEAVFNIRTKFSDMIWAKYPGICCHCLEREYRDRGQMPEKPYKPRKKCECLINYPGVEYRDDREEIKEKRREFAKMIKYAKPKTLAGMEKMFREIYEANVSVWTIESTGFHLLEEVGEIGRSLIDLYTTRGSNNQSLISIEAKEANLCDEIAETFSWICSLTAKLRQLFKPTDDYYESMVMEKKMAYKLAKTIHLEWAIWKKYRDPSTYCYRCTYCGHSPCTCREDKKIEFAWEKSSPSI